MIRLGIAFKLYILCCADAVAVRLFTMCWIPFYHSSFECIYIFSFVFLSFFPSLFFLSLSLYWLYWTVKSSELLYFMGDWQKASFFLFCFCWNSHFTWDRREKKERWQGKKQQREKKHRERNFSSFTSVAPHWLQRFLRHLGLTKCVVCVNAE